MSDIAEIEKVVAEQVKATNEFCSGIANEIEKAAKSKQKLAMFMYQVLIHAEGLEDFPAEYFCEKVGVPTSYATEFAKALALAKIIKQNGEFKLVQLSVIQKFTNEILR